MNFIKQIERIKKVEKLIHMESTGNPDEFAAKLKISRAQLYRILETMKLFGAPIKYSRLNESFYYSEEYEIKIEFRIIVLAENEEKIIYGGGKSNFFSKKIFSYHKMRQKNTIFTRENYV